MFLQFETKGLTLILADHKGRLNLGKLFNHFTKERPIGNLCAANVFRKNHKKWRNNIGCFSTFTSTFQFNFFHELFCYIFNVPSTVILKSDKGQVCFCEGTDLEGFCEGRGADVQRVRDGNQRWSSSARLSVFVLVLTKQEV